jgi:hypothetical protein
MPNPASHMICMLYKFCNLWLTWKMLLFWRKNIRSWGKHWSICLILTMRIQSSRYALRWYKTCLNKHEQIELALHYTYAQSKYPH